MAMPYFLRIWSIAGGIRDGLVVDQPPIPETEHPAAAMYWLTRQTEVSINVFLELAGHLRDDRTRRLLRDLIRHCRQTTQQVVRTMGASPPLSVTMAERIDALRRWAKGRCVPAE